MKHCKTHVHTAGREIISNRRGKENENSGLKVVEEKPEDNIVTIVIDSDAAEINEKV